jgi:NADPH-dependent 2,4-dienoyl-CoA reductase/sulfur reductase-like enzyme
LRFVITILDSDDARQADLRGGHSPWQGIAHHDSPRLRLAANIRCDALIVGGGITGSQVAERLTRQGLDVVIIGRELPGRGRLWLWRQRDHLQLSHRPADRRPDRGIEFATSERFRPRPRRPAVTKTVTRMARSAIFDTAKK